MSDIYLKVPGSPPNTNMDHKKDRVFVTVVADLKWTYTDGNPPCFPHGFLPPGCYLATSPNTTYGPYLAVTGGIVHYVEDAGKCDPDKPLGIVAGTQHTITVS